RRPAAYVADADFAVFLTHVDAGRVEANAHVRFGAVEPVVVEPRQHDVVHGVAGRGVRDERARQEPRDGGVAVREVINIWLLAFGGVLRRQTEAGKTRIAELGRVGGRHRIAAEAEEAEGAALETVRHLLTAVA